MFDWFKKLFRAILDSVPNEPSVPPQSPVVAAPLAQPKPVVAPPAEPSFTDLMQEELEIDEGVVYKIYLDHLGLPTFGIGHLIIDGDPEMGQAVGTPVSPERVREAFERDLKNSIEDCKALFLGWNKLPLEARRVTCNMAFNLGRTRLAKFRKFRAAVDSKDWVRAAKEMKDSRWYHQVGGRSMRLRNRILSLAGI